MTSQSNDIWLIGAGGMAVDYARVLVSMGLPAIVIGRGGPSAVTFTEKAGVPVRTGGLDAFLATGPAMPVAAIVAVGALELGSVTRRLLNHGVRRILVEKPGAMDLAELRELVALAHAESAEVFVAYNRRMYASTLHAQQMMAQDGGPRSMHFEFTEWSHVIAGQDKPQAIKTAWLMANSTHVIDLAFHLGGAPAEMVSFTAGGLDWHPRSAVFAGAGKTDLGVLFSYQANWDAPGRWGLEVLSTNYRFIFRPMESLQIVRKGSVALEPVALDDPLDKAFKPGLHVQVARFLDGQTAQMCTLAHQLALWPSYAQIAAYPQT